MKSILIIFLFFFAGYSTGYAQNNPLLVSSSSTFAIPGTGSTEGQILFRSTPNNRTLQILPQRTTDGDVLNGYVFDAAYTNSAAANGFLFRTGSSNRLIINENGNVGIGSINPTNKLQIENAFSFHDGGHDVIGFGWAHGAPSADLNPSGYASEIRMDPYNGRFQFGVSSTITDQPTTYMTLTNDGKVGIGTTNPDHELTVKGKIHAEEILVDLNVPGPDYVFEADYDLPTLGEIEAFIKANKHLPEVPSAARMEKEGITLGEMNMLLLKKIEELTLHMIELNKENQQLKERVKQLEDQ